MSSKKNKKQRSKKPQKRKKAPKVDGAINKSTGTEVSPLDPDASSLDSIDGLDSEPIDPDLQTTKGYGKRRPIDNILTLLSSIVSLFIAFHPYLANGKFCAIVNGNEVKSPVIRNCLVYFDSDSVDLTSIDIFPQIKNDSKIPLKDVNLKYTIQSKSADIDFTSDYKIYRYKKSKEAINVDKTIYSNFDAPKLFEQFVIKDEGRATIDLEATYAGAKKPFLYHSEIYARKRFGDAMIMSSDIVDFDASKFSRNKGFDHKCVLCILLDDEVKIIEDYKYNQLLMALEESDTTLKDDGETEFCHSSDSIIPEKCYSDVERNIRRNSISLEEHDRYNRNIYKVFKIFKKSEPKRGRDRDGIDFEEYDRNRYDDESNCIPITRPFYKRIIVVIIVCVICLLGLFIIIRRVQLHGKNVPSYEGNKSNRQVKLNTKEGDSTKETNSIGVNKNKAKKTWSLSVIQILLALLLYVSLYFILGIFFETSRWFWQGFGILSIALVSWPVSRWIVNALSKNRSDRFPKELISILLWILLISFIALLFVFFI